MYINPTPKQLKQREYSRKRRESMTPEQRERLLQQLRAWRKKYPERHRASLSRCRGPHQVNPLVPGQPTVVPQHWVASQPKPELEPMPVEQTCETNEPELTSPIQDLLEQFGLADSWPKAPKHEWIGQIPRTPRCRTPLAVIEQRIADLSEWQRNFMSKSR